MDNIRMKTVGDAAMAVLWRECKARGVVVDGAEFEIIANDEGVTFKCRDGGGRCVEVWTSAKEIMKAKDVHAFENQVLTQMAKALAQAQKGRS
jgi:hypothetical protein